MAEGKNMEHPKATDGQNFRQDTSANSDNKTAITALKLLLELERYLMQKCDQM